MFQQFPSQKHQNLAMSNDLCLLQLTVDPTVLNYIIAQIILAFGLVLAYDLLEDRCTTEVIESLFCSYYILTSSVIYYRTADVRQHGIYLLNRTCLQM